MPPRLTADQRHKARHKAQTDLWFLCNDLLAAFNGNRFSETPHKGMCEFYVKKDPTVSFREFSKIYTGPHERQMLVPRQARKSGIKIIDNVQWIINYPEVRIMTCTATKDLSTAFINQLAHYFVVKGKAERNPETNRLEGGDPTMFQIVFPEHCITESEATQGEYISPVRYDPGNNFGVAVPTAGTLSMDGSSSGWRCDVLDFDDPVSDRNSESGVQLDKLNNRIAMISELLMTGGFKHTVGTRYQPDDPYGKQAESSGIVELYGDYEKDGLRYMCKPCLWLKGQPYKQPDYATQGFPAEKDIDLFYPEGPSYAELKKKFKNPRVFFSQQLNDPHNATSVEFTEDLIRSCLCDYSSMPKTGLHFVFWDLAATAKKTSDQTAGAVGMIDDQRRWWIYDVIWGRFHFTERIHQVIKAISLYRPKRTGIEDNHGSQENMRDPLDREAKQAKVSLDIDWVSQAGANDAKYLRILGLHSWMSSHRIFFCNSIPCVDDLVRQFRNTKPRNTAADDIPDAISRLVEQYTRYAVEVKAPSTVDDQQRWKEIEEREFYNIIFRKGKYAPVEPVVRVPEAEPPSAGIDELFK